MLGVCIKYFHENYGGMLQAYATIKIMESQGIDYELIRYQKKHSFPDAIKSLPRLLNRILLNDKYEALQKLINIKRHPDFKKNNTIRLKAFEMFQKNHFTKLSPLFIGYKELCRGALRYDMVMTGSDQLWSPAGLPTNFYNLMFVPNEICKVSFSSSFGVHQIPWYQKKRTAEFLSRIDYISMRESSGGAIVKQLTGRNVPVLSDPVFYFSQEEWGKIIPYENETNDKYIFAYFLGSNPTHREAVNDLASITKKKIITLRHLDQYIETDENFGDFAPYDVDPKRFLNLLRNADYVCTDSFHGLCFSLIHQKKFMIFNRYKNESKVSKNSRIDSLCNNLNIQNRRFNGNNIKDIFAPIDFDNINYCLNKFSKSIKKYLNPLWMNKNN